MGYSTTVYVAYGVHIPVNPYSYDENNRNAAEQVDHALSVPTVRAACPDVGYLSVGTVDRDTFFLVTKCKEVGYGPAFVQDLANNTENQKLAWDRQIMHAIEIMGWGGLSDSFTIGWFVVASTD